MPDERWKKVNTKSPTGIGPPCENCGTDRSERYRTGMGTIRCVNLRGCVNRRRQKSLEASNG